MPTGYTAAIAEGIEFDKFVLQCARAMGACVSMRDKPSSTEIPKEFETSQWNNQQREAAAAKLEDLNRLTPDQADEMAKQAYAQELKIHGERIERNNALRLKYRQMLSKVREWEPPTPDHVGLKDFMVDQIAQSIDSDCDNKYLLDRMPRPKTGVEWLTAEMDKANCDVKYHIKKQAEEAERVKSRNLWVKQLRESLGGE